MNGPIMNGSLYGWRLAWLLLATAVGGCGGGQGGAVSLESLEQSRTLSASFPHAYITQLRPGEYDVVLVDSATDWDYRSPGKNKPLKPTPLEPVRQMMHLHLYWRPLMGTTRNPAATNASIDWYVMGADGGDDLIVYGGAGYVALRGSGSTRTVVIRDGQIRPKQTRGSLQDPIGPASISGQVQAIVDDARVRDTLAEMEKQAGVVSK